VLCSRKVQLDPSALAHSESIFALASGHLGVRANFDEVEPHGLLGIYLNSFTRSGRELRLRAGPGASSGVGSASATRRRFRRSPDPNTKVQ